MPLFWKDLVLSTNKKMTFAYLSQKWALDPKDPMTDAQKKLIAAARNNLVKHVLNGLDAGIPIDFVVKGLTVLTWGAYEGSVEVVIALIDRGFDPRYAGHSEKSAYNTFHAACAGGQLLLAQTLLEKYPQFLTVDMPDEMHGQSGLQIAILKNRLIFANRFIEQEKPNLLHVDKHGRTPLMTTLGAFMRGGIEQLIADKQLDELEKLTLNLLSQENAFVKVQKEAKTAISALFNAEFSCNLPKDQEVNLILSLEQTVHQVVMLCPAVADKLYQQATEQRDKEMNLSNQNQLSEDDIKEHNTDMLRISNFISAYKKAKNQRSIIERPALADHLKKASER